LSESGSRVGALRPSPYRLSAALATTRANGSASTTGTTGTTANLRPKHFCDQEVWRRLVQDAQLLWCWGKVRRMVGKTEVWQLGTDSTALWTRPRARAVRSRCQRHRKAL